MRFWHSRWSSANDAARSRGRRNSLGGEAGGTAEARIGPGAGDAPAAYASGLVTSRTSMPPLDVVPCSTAPMPSTEATCCAVVICDASE